MRNRILVSLLVLAALAGGIAIGTALSDEADGDGAPSASTAGQGETTSSSAPPTTGSPGRASVVVSTAGVLGWWDGDAWVAATAHPSTAVPLRGGEDFAVIVAGEPTATRARGGTPGDPPEFCSAPQLDLDPPLHVHSGTGPGPNPVAVHGVADPVPRPATVLPDPTSTYGARVVEELREHGIDDPVDEVVQALRVDLEGDGVDEVLLVAERLAEPEARFARAGDYSAVFLRRVVDGHVLVEPLHLEVNESTPDAPSPYLLVARVDAVADLDGDGAMEVVLGESYYEGSSTTVFGRAPDGSLRELLAAGCGV